MGVGAGLYVYVVVVQKFTFAISSPDEFLYNKRIYHIKNQATDRKTIDARCLVFNLAFIRHSLCNISLHPTIILRAFLNNSMFSCALLTLLVFTHTHTRSPRSIPVMRWFYELHSVSPSVRLSVRLPALKGQIPLRYLVADRFEAGRGPYLLARASSLLAN